MEAAAVARPLVEPASVLPRPERIAAIDWLRGLVMVLMALDHVRTFFGHMPFPPEDMEHTWMALFLTRWVTHFCAPLFFLLAGTSAYLSGLRRGTGELAGHLWRRGLWLIVLELTVIGFAWSFVPGSSFAGVIWCLGWSMILLALLVRLPLRVIGALALVVIATHDLFDGVQSSNALWHILHVAGPVQITEGFYYFVLFPLIPWAAVMALGYVMGPLFQQHPRARRRTLVLAGSIATLLFVVLRLTNLYGNPATAYQHGGPGHFHVYDTVEKTIIAFLNTEKYPPSLHFLLMTLGPSLLALAALDALLEKRMFARWMITFGRVPFAFYVAHLYLIHLAAIAVAAATKRESWPVEAIWIFWLLITAALYPLCRLVERLKERQRGWWWSYV